jgi:predicted MFS family arabinose efflux permease
MRPRLKFEVGLIAATRFILHTSYRMMYPFLTTFAVGMGVDVQAISLAIAAYSTSGAFSPFLASIADSRGRKAGILLGLGVFLVGPLLIVLRPGYPSFFAAMIFTSIGVSVFVPTTHAYLGDQVPYERRGLVISISELSWSAAFIVGVPLVGLLIAKSSWSAPYPIIAVAGVAVFALFAWRLRTDRPPADSQNIFANFKRVLTYGPALAGILISIAITAGNEAVNLVFGIWMGASFNLQLTALGAASMVLGIAELGGEGLAAAVVDHMGKQRAITLGLAANVLSLGLFLLLGRTVAGALVGLFFFYLTFEFSILAFIPLMTEVHPAVRGTLMALVAAGFSLGRAIGALVGAPVYQSWGILANALLAIALDLAGLALLRWVQVRQSAPTVEQSI